MFLKQTQFYKKTLNRSVILALLLTPVIAIHADTNTVTSEEAQQVQRVKEAVMQELRNSDFLQQEIQNGIQAYIKKQQADQVAAAAAEEHRKDALAKNVRRINPERDHIYGDPKAKVTIIEYSDLDCPYCKRFHDTPKKVVENYNGRVNWVYRHFPLNFHPTAMKKAEASECAAELGGNDGFWKFTDALYAGSPAKDNTDPIEKFVSIAEKNGLNRESFKSCLTSAKYVTRVTEDFQEGTRLGINGTPGSILLNSETGETIVVSGAMPLEAITAKIEQIIN
jgi:protein-disulfide isomerase